LSAAAHNIFDIGASGIPVDSTLAGKRMNESYNALKNFSRITLSNTLATQFPNCPCGYTEVFNLLGNDIVFVGGLPGSDDDPYLEPSFPGMGRGWPVYPGTGKRFRVNNSNLLQAIANRNNDIIIVQAHLSQADFVTDTMDPVPAPPPPNLPSLVAPLTVTANTPANGATNIATNTVATITFLRNMDPNTVSLTNITVSPAVTGLTVYVDPANPNQIDIDPHGANLAFSTTYTITATTNVKDTLGNALSSSFTFSFTTGSAPPPPDTTPPYEQTRTPADGATNVSIAVQPTILMSEAVDPTSVNTTNIILKITSNNVLVARTVTLDQDGRTIHISPTSNLAYSTQYSMTMQYVKDLAGNVAVPQTTKFTTGALTYTQRYTVAQSSCTCNQDCYPSSYYLTGGSNIAIGEKALSSKTGQNLVGFVITKVVVTRINTHSTSNLSGNLTVQICNGAGVVKYTFQSSYDLSSYNRTNLTSSPITIVDSNNHYTILNGDVIFIRWQNPNSDNMQVSTGTSGGSGAPYGELVFWDGVSTSYTTKTSDDLAITCYSTP